MVTVSKITCQVRSKKTNTTLQQPCEFTIPVSDMGLLGGGVIPQDADDIAQAQETLVDVDTCSTVAHGIHRSGIKSCQSKQTRFIHADTAFKC